MAVKMEREREREREAVSPKMTLGTRVAFFLPDLYLIYQPHIVTHCLVLFGHSFETGTADSCT